MRTSFSALETYKLCPQKFKFEFIDRVPAKKTKAAVFGTEVHAALRRMFAADPLFPTADEVAAFFRERWNAQDKLELDPTERDAYREEGERIIRDFYAKNPPWTFTVADLESTFEVLLEDVRRRETHVLAGRIDRIDKIGNGYEVIDYKTNRRLPSQADVDTNLQLSIYALGLARRWPHVDPSAVTLSLYFLKHGEKLSTKRSAAEIEETAHEVLGTVTEIGERLADGKRFDPTPGPHCGTCPYRPICPAWRHLYTKNQGSATTGREEITAALAEYFSILKSQREAERKLAELKLKFRTYMAEHGYTRLFSDEGSVAAVQQQRFSHDWEQVRAILEPLGKWEEILVADEKRLRGIAKTLPPEVRTALEGAKRLIREFTVLTTSMKKMRAPDESEVVMNNE